MRPYDLNVKICVCFGNKRFVGSAVTLYVPFLSVYVITKLCIRISYSVYCECISQKIFARENSSDFLSTFTDFSAILFTVSVKLRAFVGWAVNSLADSSVFGVHRRK